MEGSRPASVEDLPRIAELAELARDELVPMKGGALWSAREAVAEPFDDAYGAFIDRDERDGKGASDHAPVIVDLE